MVLKRKVRIIFNVGCVLCLDGNVPLKSRRGAVLCPFHCQFAVSPVHLLEGSPGCTASLCAGINRATAFFGTYWLLQQDSVSVCALPAAV